jgi:drug/metabolite transporter (DMT)-like permease
LWSLFSVVWLKADTLVDAPLKSPFRLLSVAFSLALGAAFLGDTLKPLAWASFGLIIVGTLVASVREKSFHAKKWAQSGLVLMVLGSIFSALASFADKHVITAFDVPAYMFLNWVGSGAAMALANRPRAVEVRALVASKPVVMTVRVALEIVAYVAWLTAYTRASYSSVTLVMQLIIPFTFAGGVFLLGERVNLRWRLGGTALAFAGGLMAVLT